LKISDNVRSEHEYEFIGPALHVAGLFKSPVNKFEVTLQNVSPGKNYGKAILIDNHLFLLVWEIREDTFYFAVFYARP
jgi:predicted RNA-binding protein with PUA domain